jgi:hypothetical protein
MILFLVLPFQALETVFVKMLSYSYEFYKLLEFILRDLINFFIYVLP